MFSYSFYFSHVIIIISLTHTHTLFIDLADKMSRILNQQDVAKEAHRFVAL